MKLFAATTLILIIIVTIYCTLTYLIGVFLEKYRNKLISEYGPVDYLNQSKSPDIGFYIDMELRRDKFCKPLSNVVIFSVIWIIIFSIVSGIYILIK